MTAILTIRVDDKLACMAKERAPREGVSLNQFGTGLFQAALDPRSAGALIDSLRERSERGGVEVCERAPGSTPPAHPDPEVLAAAMKAAGKGTSLAEVVSAGRR